MNPAAMRRLTELLPQLDYDLCVLTGDYRGRTYGPCEPTIAGMADIRRHLTAPAYAVLGNHDLLRMVPAFEAMGIGMLVNEAVPLLRGGARVHLAGIDDAHYYRTHNIEKAAAAIPHGELAILLSHTPEIYRQAAHAGFDLMLSGHTHGGQICLPGAIPLTLDFGPAAPYGARIVALCRDDRLHLGRGRVEHRLGPAQLPAGNHVARAALRLSAQYGRSRKSKA